MDGKQALFTFRPVHEQFDQAVLKVQRNETTQIKGV